MKPPPSDPGTDRGEEQARRERIIFGLFASAARLPIRAGSVESRPAGEPDILCTIIGEGPVAFELVEVVTSAFAEVTSVQQQLRQRFRDGYAALPEPTRRLIHARLGGPPTLHVGFVRDTPPGTWLHAVPLLLARLAERAETLESGDVPVWEIPSLRDIVDEVIVRSGSSDGPDLFAMEMTEVFDETLKRLTSKFGKHYQSSAPIELVAYYISQPPAHREGWLEAARGFIANNLDGSPFRRVWLFDHFSSGIPLAVPPRPADSSSAPKSPRSTDRSPRSSSHARRTSASISRTRPSWT